MSIKYADRVLETSTSQGVGTINLLGAVPGFQSFVSGVGNGNKCAYFIEDGLDWESGIGTVTSGSPDTLSRDTVLKSSNSNVAVDWGPGTRNVFLGASSSMLIWRDENLNDVSAVGTGGGTGNAQTVTMAPVPLAYSPNMVIRWKSPAANSGNVTVNVNGLGAKQYVDANGSQFPSGYVKNGALQQAYYDSVSDKFISLNVLVDIPDAAVTAAKLATDAVETAKIKDANVTLGKLGSDVTALISQIPQNSKSASYTLVASDAGKHIYHPSADTTGRTFTIPANSSVAYPIGTVLTFLNDASAGDISIAITSDTMVQDVTGATGTRTLKGPGRAVAVKVASTRWMIGGSNLT